MPAPVIVPARASSSTTTPQSTIDTAYTLSLLSEYTHTLDALPNDLSRNFADLRELDAVLSSSMATIIAKIRELTHMIESGTATKQDRLWLLTEIAEEAAKLKPGGEDKIRVACVAADNLKSHRDHMRALVEHVPDFDLSVLNRKTTYPHVSARSFMPVHTFESGRRRRGQVGSLLLVNNNPSDSPAKRKRVAKEDDLDVGPQRSPRKEPGQSTARGRNSQRKKTERAPSPSESVVSITNHIPIQQTNSTSSRTSGTKRSRTTANRNPTPLTQDPVSYPIHQEYPIPSIPSSAHPSLLQYQNTTAASYDMHLTAQDWAPLHATQLEGPGMPVARATSIHSAVSALPQNMNGSVVGTDGAPTEAGDADGDGDGDGDDRRYCICNGVSYGEMIACDDTQCEKEWFHLSCIGLSVPPDGRWFCDSCLKRNNKRGGRGGKRRGAANRAGAKSA